MKRNKQIKQSNFYYANPKYYSYQSNHKKENNNHKKNL